MTTNPMTKGERDELLRLVKQREKVAKTGATQRSAVLLAEFEAQISAIHSFDTDEVWSAVAESAKTALDEANVKIEARAAELGIVPEFRPALHFSWASRNQSAVKERRDELRRAAKAEIEVMEQTARLEIEAKSIDAQTKIVASGLTSDAAVMFLNSLPAVETLMPPLTFKSIQKRIEDHQANRRHRLGYSPEYQ